MGKHVLIMKNKGQGLSLFIVNSVEWGLRPFGKSSETFWASISNPL